MPIRPLLTALLCACLLSAPTAQAAPKTFKLCWSVFAGWMPWDYAAKQGIVKKWADKYGIDIQVQEVPDYVASIERYSAGQFDACTMTNMDALTIPAAAGTDSTALIIGDFSNGADGLLLRGSGKSIREARKNRPERSPGRSLTPRRYRDDDDDGRGRGGNGRWIRSLLFG